MNCPFCSAPVKPNWPTYPPDPQDGISWFTCGTMIWTAKPSRGDQTRLCVEGEVGGLKARIARLEEAGDRLVDSVDALREVQGIRGTGFGMLGVVEWTKAKEAKP